MINSRYKAALDEANEQIDRLSEIVKKYDKKAMITGEVPLTKDLINVADVDFKVTSYVSILSIFIIIAFCFKSISIPFLLVAIIEFAIFINVGIPFFTGTVIPFISPTIIGCVQLGATVDYAILMTTRYQEELRNGYDKHEAIKIAANSSDRAILTSSLVFFCATFGVSMVSQIEMIQSICSMLARGALISAATIMCILSVVLLITEKVIDKTTYRWKTNPQEIMASQYNEKQEAAL
jgi:predicted RND superfamily exporter protein